MLYTIHNQILHKKALLQNEPYIDKNITQWHSIALTAHANLIKAQEEASRGGRDAAAQIRVDEAQAQVDKVWKDGMKVLGVVVEGYAAEPRGAEATYQLALCKHEQAERIQ